MWLLCRGSALVADKLFIMVADWKTFVGWSIINLILQMELVQSLELGNITRFDKSAKNVIFVVVGDLISLE